MLIDCLRYSLVLLATAGLGACEDSSTSSGLPVDSGAADADDRPMFAGCARVFPPEDLG
jgi:hypothetical protein